MLKTISFIEKFLFRPYLLGSKPVKTGHYNVLPSHILRVLLPSVFYLTFLSVVQLTTVFSKSRDQNRKCLKTQRINCFPQVFNATVWEHSVSF